VFERRASGRGRAPHTVNSARPDRRRRT